MAFSPDSPDNMRKAAECVDRMLRSARPSDLPIERPTRIYLVLNQTTA